MLARLSAFVIWALVAATLVFWALRLLSHAPVAPAYTVAVGDAAAVRSDLTRLLGAPPVAAVPVAAVPEAASRFRLIGVMAPKRNVVAGNAAYGLALIAVDGKAPKAFSVGARLDGDLVLQSVSLRSASIGPAQGAAAMKLELPPLPPPATGTLGAQQGARGNATAGFLPRPVLPQLVNSPPLAPPDALQAPQQQPRDVGAPTE